jgi:hypothetical protein
VRKLRYAERRFLEAFPSDYDFSTSNLTLPGTLWGSGDWPKNTNHKTVRNLYSLGMIGHSKHVHVAHCPLILTEKGKAYLAERGKGGDAQ